MRERFNCTATKNLKEIGYVILLVYSISRGLDPFMFLPFFWVFLIQAKDGMLTDEMS